MTYALTAVATFTGDTVVRVGKIWEAGDYPDKQYSMTPEELAEAVADFKPRDVVDTHLPSVFNGKLGRLVGVAMASDGVSLLGTTEVPAWLNEVLPEDVPVSVGWNRETKRIDHLALVPDPRVSDAALTAAYAAFAKRHDTPHGQMAMQDIHDAAARGGAVCKAPTANMASRHEASGIQQAHDLAVEHGATCASMSSRGGTMPWFSKEKAMSFKDRVQAWFSAGMPEEFDPAAAGTQQPAAVAAAASDPRVSELETEVQRLKAERILDQAAAFAAAEIAAERSTPGDEEDLIAEFTQAATDDTLHGTATFSAAGGPKSRVDALKARHAKRQPHVLTQELLIAGTDAQALFNAQHTPRAGEQRPMAPERKASLMSATALGRSVLNGHQN